jgi:hypothetical protein
LMTPLPRTAAVLLKTAELSGPWHSALKLGPRTIAVHGMAIFSVAIRLENTAICQYSVTNLSADFSKIVKSISRHFTSRGPLFDVSYIFDSRLYKFKTNMRHNVSA